MEVIISLIAFDDSLIWWCLKKPPLNLLFCPFECLLLMFGFYLELSILYYCYYYYVFVQKSEGYYFLFSWLYIMSYLFKSLLIPIPLRELRFESPAKVFSFSFFSRRSEIRNLFFPQFLFAEPIFWKKYSAQGKNWKAVLFKLFFCPLILW